MSQASAGADVAHTAPMLRTSLVLPLLAAAALASATWMLYVPAARRGV